METVSKSEHWLKISGLPLTFWGEDNFRSIEEVFGGMISISPETLSIKHAIKPHFFMISVGGDITKVPTVLVKI